VSVASRAIVADLAIVGPRRPVVADLAIVAPRRPIVARPTTSCGPAA
jgi:hypothetical protein